MNAYTRIPMWMLTVSMIVIAFTSAYAQNDPKQIIQVSPADLRWSSNPALPAGPQSALLAGDPTKPGHYAMRVKIPPNFKISPHTHPDEVRMVTVISGTVYFGYGDTFDESKLQPRSAGSFFTEPKDTPHFAMTKGEEAIVQVNAVGPTGTIPVKK
jgi:quercetin dioxygenase-like cupin family protein